MNIVLSANLTIFSGCCFYGKFTKVKSTRKYKNGLKTLFFGFPLVSERNFLDTKIIYIYHIAFLNNYEKEL